MSDTDVALEGADDSKPEGDGSDRHDRHLEKEIKRRKALQSQVQELKAFKAEVEAEREAAEEANERKAQEFSKVEDRYKRRQSELEKKLADLQGQIDSQRRAGQTQKLLEGVSAETGVTNLALLRGILREAAEATDAVEVAPDDVDTTAVEAAIKAMKNIAPTVFDTTTDVGGANGSPGLNRNTLKDGQEPEDDEKRARVRELAKYFSRPAAAQE